MTESLQICDLSFVTSNGDGTKDMWAPERPADYTEACILGREYAAELIMFMQATGQAALFSSVMRAIASKNVLDGVEIGFYTGFGIYLVGIAAQPGVPEVVAFSTAD